MFKSFIDGFKKGWDGAKENDSFYVEFKDIDHKDAYDYVHGLRHLNYEIAQIMERGILTDLSVKKNALGFGFDFDGLEEAVKKLPKSQFTTNLLIMEWCADSINKQLEIAIKNKNATEDIINNILVKFYIRGFIGGVISLNEDMSPMYDKMWIQTCFFYISSKIYIFKDNFEEAIHYAEDIMGDLSYEIIPPITEKIAEKYMLYGYQEIKYLESLDKNKSGPKKLYEIIKS